MSKKPGILDAQNMPYWSLFTSCLISSSTMYGKVVGALVAITAVMFGLAIYGPAMWSAVAAGFWAVADFLQLVSLLNLLNAGLVWLFVSVQAVVTATTYGAYELTKQLLPQVLEFTAIACRSVGSTVDGKEVFSRVCDGSLTVHYPAWGVFVGVAGMWAILVIMVAVWTWAITSSWLKSIDLDLQETKAWFSLALFFMVGWLGVAALGGTLSGVTHWLATPVLQQAFGMQVQYDGVFLASVALAALVFGGPVLVLQLVMTRHVKNAQIEARSVNNTLMVGYVERDALNNEARKVLKEPTEIIIYRSVAVMMGSVAFLSMMQVGVMIWPTSIGAIVAGVIALGVVGITLACVVTCYPSLREGTRELQKARDKAVADYALVQAARAERDAAAAAERAAAAARPVEGGT